jgi:hypothetical protein
MSKPSADSSDVYGKKRDCLVRLAASEEMIRSSWNGRWRRAGRRSSFPIRETNARGLRHKSIERLEKVDRC